jgi:hypothetical protein
MYEIERKEQEVLVKRVGHTLYSAPLESYIAYKPDGRQTTVSKVAVLEDDKLLLTMATAIDLPDVTKATGRR